MGNFHKSLIFLSLTICVIAHTVLGASINIIGGEEAREDEFPFLVTIQYKGVDGENNSHNCGGTLINMTRVITAAHCVVGIPKHTLTVVAGTHLLSNAVRGLLQNRDLSNIVIHPYYRGEGSTDHDIAIVDLSSPFENPRIGSIPMPSRTQTTAGQCLIAGWGYTEAATGFSDKLMKGQVTVHSKDQCKAIFPDQFDPERQICAGKLNGETVDMCPGDTGGGLYCYNSEGLYFAGVVSWGFRCGAPGIPGVFMEISKYLNWIESVLYEDPHYSTIPVSTSTTSKSPLAGDNDGANNNGEVSSPEYHKPIVPCNVRK